MNKTSLSATCKINMGQSPDSSSYNENAEGLPFFQGNADFGTIYPKVRVWCNAPTKIAREGDILISVRAPIGALNIADTECCIGRGLAGLTVDQTVCEKKYLWYAIGSQVEQLNAKGTGSTFKAINKSVLAETEIPLPSLEEQHKIALRLDKVTELIEKRKQQLEKLDMLVKARFVEMFGEPIANCRHWEKQPLKNLCNLITGNTPSRKSKEYYGSYIEWIKSDNISLDFLYLTQAKERLSERGADVGRVVEPGAILMTCIAGSLNTIGNIAIADRRIAFNQQITALVPVKVETMYLYYLLRLIKPQIHEFTNTALKCIINKGTLEQIEVIVPDQDLQVKFSDIAKQVSKSKIAIQKSVIELEILKKALMQKYFG